MADRLTRQKTFYTVAVLFGLCGSAMSMAETLPDPTRPPPGFVDSIAQGGAADRAAVPLSTSETEAAASVGPLLQSVVLPKRGRPIAIISGKYVPLGERYAGMELVSVSEQEVVLASGSVRRVLKLTPAARKSVSNRRATSSGEPAELRDSPQDGQRRIHGIRGRGQ